MDRSFFFCPHENSMKFRRLIVLDHQSYIDRPFSDVLILAVHRYEPSPPRTHTRNAPPTAAAAAVFLLRSSLLKQTTGPPSSPHPVHPSLLGCAPRVALYAGEALSPPHRADFPFCGCAGIIRKEEEDMPLGLILSSLGRSMRRKRLSSLGILSSKRAPRDYYKGKNCKPTGFHTRKGNALRDAL